MKSTQILRRTITLFLAAALCVGSLAGCSTGGGASSAADSGASPAAAGDAADSSEAPADNAAVSTADSSGGAVIRIAWWGNQLRNDTTTAFLDAYKEKNPGMSYEAEFTDWSGYWDKLATQAASNNLPDIIQQDYMYITQYHTKGQLASLTEQINAGNLNVDDVSESILTTGTFDNELFALCAGVNAVGMLYNTRLAKEAGVEVPLRISYQDIMDMSAKIYAATGVRGQTPWKGGPMQMMCRDVGERYLDPETNTIGASEATVLKYFQQAKDTIDSEWSISVDIIQEDETAGVENSSLSTGKSWNFFPGGSNQMAAYEAPMDDELAMVMYPTVADATQESMYLRPSQFFSITSSSANKEEAARIINSFTNDDWAQDLLMAERGVPVSSKMAAYLEPKLDPVQQRVFAYIAEVTKVAVPFDPPQPNGANEIDKLLVDLTDLVRYGELTPEQATARFLPEAQDILTKANA